MLKYAQECTKRQFSLLSHNLAPQGANFTAICVAFLSYQHIHIHRFYFL